MQYPSRVRSCGLGHKVVFIKASIHVLISGRVQGVWYRASTKQKAEQLGITGWVRNTEDGCVEAVFQGSEKQVNEMINWCYKGPPLAKVDDVKIVNKDISEMFEDFILKH
jgi:acylphosphatase